MKACLLTIVLFSASVNYSQPANLITNINSREKYSLNGNWNIIIDPYETGYYNYRFEPSSNGYFVNRKPGSKSELIEYDFDNSPTLNVPGDWNTQREDLFFYEGTVWYKKSFDYNPDFQKRLFLYFGAVNYHAVIYFNGEKLGEHIGGFTPFNFEITQHVKPGDNFVIVKVDNKRHRDAVPTVNTDWWNYGGITRDVYIIETPSTFIEDYSIQLSPQSTNQIKGWVNLNGSEVPQNVFIKIPSAGINYKTKVNAGNICEINFTCEFNLWSPGNPYLYEVIVKTDSDSIRDQIGFRTIGTRGTKILLNNKEIFLRGISIHEESPFTGGRANSIEDARKLLSWAKELNCNFVRLAHYPHNENIIREADKEGLLIWSEIPVYWTIQWKNPKTYSNAENQLSEMINRDKNSAAVIIWSVANETPRSEERLNFLKQLISKVKQLDNTRLISAATELHYEDKTIMIDDPLGEYLDVIGANEYIGWYSGKPVDALNYSWGSTFNKPLIISEFGGGAKYGYHGDAETRWTEEYQESIYNYQTQMIERIDFLAGISPWILVDFRSPRRPLPNIQDYYNRKGLISERGQKKKAFYILQSFYEKLILSE